jgi:hypothetical protein
MAPALRFSILPLIDSIASELQTEPIDIYSIPHCETHRLDFMPGVSRLPEAWHWRLLNLQRLIDSKYFARCTQLNAAARSTTLAAEAVASPAKPVPAVAKRKHSQL